MKKKQLSLPSLPLQFFQTLEIQGANEIEVMVMKVMRISKKMNN